jgi:hypothetical protein
VPLQLTDRKIDELLAGFLNNRTRTETHRYESFDFCYSHFLRFTDKHEMASEENLENSCLNLAWYLASWGMLRGSSFLLSKSLRFYAPIIKLVAQASADLWQIDVDRYTATNQKQLVEMYNKIWNLYPGKRKLTLTTKIMLGVFGNAPAMDRYVTATFKEIYPVNGFCSFRKSLPYFKEFYESHKEVIDKNYLCIKCLQFKDGRQSPIPYPKIKLIDMIMFQYALSVNSKKVKI